MNIIKKLSVGAVTAAFSLSAFAPAVFASDMVIDGNGSQSSNTIVVTNSTNCDVTQSSKIFVWAGLSAVSSTGGNKATGNTGDGGVTIDTGDATSTVSMSVTGGDNTALNPCCGCEAQPTGDKKIVDNGEKSTNAIVETNASSKSLSQKSKTKVGAKLSAKSKTGKNKAKNNTGSGEVEIKTGESTTDVLLEVVGGSNNLP